jgi:phosphonate transport system ATP-binding protein
MIHLNAVTVRYGDFVALHPATLSIRPGQFTVLLGPSGAGKSTLLRCLNLMSQPHSGSVEVDGIGVLKGRAALQRHRRQTGMIFQQHQLLGRQSALRNVLMGRIGYHSALRSLFPLPPGEQAIGLRSLERVGLLDKALARVDQLSGGQQQRVGIARALTQQPRLLLADEPVASLDPATADKVLALLHQVCKEDGIAAVVSLHQLDLARRYADRILGLAQGRVVFDQPPEHLTPARAAELYQQPALAAAGTTPIGPPPIGTTPIPLFSPTTLKETA